MIPSAASTAAPAALVEVLITSELSRRRPWRADHAAENRGLVVLAREMANAPESLLNKLVEMALELCRAGSSGISLLRKDAEEEYFSWDAMAGVYAPHLGGRTPRDFSPCGITLDRGAIQLFSYPGRYFEYFQAVEPPIVEGLVIPLYAQGRPLGTLWVVSHDADRRFDAEDARIMSSLGEFTGAALQMQSSLGEATAARVELEQAAAELREVNRSLRETEQLRQEADRRKDEFLATLAHELRNPLAPIRNALHLLRIKPGAPAGERALEIADRQVTHLVRLVDDLLEVSRITRGKLDLRREPIALERAVWSAVETSRPLIEAAGHELTIEIEDETLTVEADLVRISQVISNLLNNAAKYTQRGGRISLTVTGEDEEAVVRVRDSGIGIPADQLRGIFEMFTQLDGSHGHSQGGLGIGLALVRSLVQMHGGSVEAESDGPGRGSVFTVRLPLATVS